MNQNTNYDPDKYYKDYMNMLNNPNAEMIRSAGGLDNYNKIVKKWKRDQKLLSIKNTIKFNLEYYFGWVPKAIYILLVIYIINYFFF